MPLQPLFGAQLIVDELAKFKSEPLRLALEVHQRTLSRTVAGLGQPQDKVEIRQTGDKAADVSVILTRTLPINYKNSKANEFLITARNNLPFYFENHR